MSDYILHNYGYSWTPDHQDRTAAARPVRPGSSGELVMRILAAIASAVIAIILLAVFLVLPLTKIRSWELYGAATIGDEELMAWSGMSGTSYLFTLDPDALVAGLLTHPRIADADARMVFPNRLIVRISERVPLAVVFARGPDGRMEAHCVDGQAVVFAPVTAYAGASDLPVISGVEIRGLQYGMNLGAPFTGLLASMADLAVSEPALLRVISEIRIIAREGSLPEALVYPANYRLPVRMRPVLNAELLKSMMLVLDVVEGRGLSASIRELDLRSDTFVYRIKEAISG
jgi:cell division protein FtsQ